MSRFNRKMAHTDDDDYEIDTDYEVDDDLEEDTDDEDDFLAPVINQNTSVATWAAPVSNPSSALNTTASGFGPTTSALNPTAPVFNPTALATGITASAFGLTPSATNTAATVPGLTATIPSLAITMPNPAHIVPNPIINAPNPSGYTPNTLRPINDLTRISANPGNLQYNEYVAYLRSIGHVVSGNAPANPLNSNLQHNTGDRMDNMTDFRADQAYWSMDNLPEILYALSRPANWLEKFELVEPPLKQYLINGQRLRDLPILPDHISNALEGWRLEAWVRMDPRVGHANIVARIPKKHRPANKSRIQMRTKRFRESFPSCGWISAGKNLVRDTNTLRARMQAAGIALNNNSTRGVSWGLNNPAQGEAGGRVVVPESQRQPSTIDETMFNATPLPSVVTAPIPVTAPVTAPVITTFTTLPTNTGSAVPSSAVTTISHTTVLAIPNFPTNPNTNLPSTTRAGRSIPSTRPSLTNTLSNPNNPAITGTMTAPPSRRGPKDGPRTPDHQAPANQTRQTRSQAATTSSPRQILSSDLGSTSEDAIAAPTDDRIRVTYQGRVLTLRTQYERVNMSNATITMMQTFFPAGSEGRARQLEYVLCPVRAPRGFIDNHGNEEYVPADAAASFTDVDVIYLEGSLRRFGREE